MTITIGVSMKKDLNTLPEALFISISIKNNARIFKFHTHSQKWLKIIKLI